MEYYDEMVSDQRVCFNRKQTGLESQEKLPVKAVDDLWYGGWLGFRESLNVWQEERVSQCLSIRESTQVGHTWGKTELFL